MNRVSLLLIVLRRWVLSRIQRSLVRVKSPIHVLFCMVDHYEPGAFRVTPEVQVARVQRLVDEYPRLAHRHRDANGNPACRTWFFPPHDHRYGNLNRLVSLCAMGYGEIELHLHHGKTHPDTSSHLERTIQLCIDEYSQLGIFGTENKKKRFAFIHGDWALDNARHNQYCGVNDELTVLERSGCYADFTFPSCNEANPKKINSLFYAVDDPLHPYSHCGGSAARTGRTSEGLLMVQGPLHPMFLTNDWKSLRVSGDDVTVAKPATAKRIDSWITTHIHVLGRPEWIIVKVHTHGTVDADAVLGSSMDSAFDYLENTYNDGVNYVLHYVTAREVYNIIKAAESGESGDPELYRDYLIKPPQYTVIDAITQASDELRQAVYRTYVD